MRIIKKFWRKGEGKEIFLTCPEIVKKIKILFKCYFMLAHLRSKDQLRTFVLFLTNNGDLSTATELISQKGKIGENEC